MTLNGTPVLIKKIFPGKMGRCLKVSRVSGDGRHWHTIDEIYIALFSSPGMPAHAAGYIF